MARDRKPSQAVLDHLAGLRLARLRSGRARDDVLLNVRCPRCRRNTIVARELRATPEGFDFSEFLARGEHLPGYRVRCACRMALGPRDATAVQHDHFFPEVQRDLQLVTWGGEGRLLSRMNLQGVSQPLPPGAGEEELRVALGLPRPVAATWRELFARCLESGAPVSAMVEDGHVLVAMPPGEGRDLEEELGDVPEARGFEGGVYAVGLEASRWAGTHAEDLALGRLRAYALFDPQAARARAQKLLAALGATFSEGPDGFILHRAQFQWELPTLEVMRLAAASGVGLDQATLEAMDQVEGRLHRLEDLYAKTVRLAEGLEVRVDGNMAYVRDPSTNREEGFDIRGMAGRDAGVEELASLLEELFSRLASRQPPIACTCGRPSWIGKHLRSRHWLDGENATAAHRPRDEAVEVYTVECREHFTPLHPDDLERAGVELEELERLWEQDLEREPLDLRVSMDGSGDQRLIYVVGPNASDLALHPGMVVSLLRHLGITVNPDRPHLNVYVVTTDALVFYQDITFDRLRAAYDRCLEVELGVLGRHGEDINYIDRTLLFSQPRGRLKVSLVVEGGPAAVRTR